MIFYHVLSISLLFGLFYQPSTNAMPQFYNAFKTQYLTDDVSDEYKETIQETKCAVCHSTKTKKILNDYGTALVNAGLSKTDKGDAEKIMQALLDVEDVAYDETDPESETFGERIENEELPTEVIDTDI